VDEVEQDRLDLHHEVFLGLLEGELLKAPIKDPHRILDVGTGTGIWAIDIADKYPMAEVIGTDITPIQPAWVPPNWCAHPNVSETLMECVLRDVVNLSWTMRRRSGRMLPYVASRPNAEALADRAGFV
jgi:SAM-dependent methyltransferase